MVGADAGDIERANAVLCGLDAGAIEAANNRPRGTWAKRGGLHAGLGGEGVAEACGTIPRQRFTSNDGARLSRLQVVLASEG